MRAAASQRSTRTLGACTTEDYSEVLGRAARTPVRSRRVFVVLDAQILKARLVALADARDAKLGGRRVAQALDLEAVVQRLVLLARQIHGLGQRWGETDAARSAFPAGDRRDRNRLRAVAAAVPDGHERQPRERNALL